MSYNDKIKDCYRIIEQVFKEYKREEIAITLNGGKDNIVMIDMIANYVNSTDIPISFNVINDNDFDEIKIYTEKIINKYKLNVIQYNGSIKDSLIRFKEDYPLIQVIFMAVRSNDLKNSDCKDIFQVTDSNWPKYIRVYPLMKLSYSDIWKYILDNQIEYCNLYDQGYTSIGCKNKTSKNDKLQYIENGKIKYYPAYMLKDELLERDGRNKY